MESTTTDTKIKLGIFFGGKSAEHEVSLQSAKNVIEALDKEKFEPILVLITKLVELAIERHARRSQLKTNY